MRIACILAFAAVFALGCARVQVEAPKEPIKMDITMRLDVYQHVQKDIDAIEDIVSGSSPSAVKAPGPLSMLDVFTGTAYAGEGLSPEVEKAAYNRKDRLPELSSWEAKGVVGENKKGLVEIRSQSEGQGLGSMISDENADRMIIYKELAQKNGTSVSDVQKIYAERLQANAPAGTPVESQDGSWNTK